MQFDFNYKSVIDMQLLDHRNYLESRLKETKYCAIIVRNDSYNFDSISLIYFRDFHPSIFLIFYDVHFHIFELNLILHQSNLFDIIVKKCTQLAYFQVRLPDFHR